MYSEMKSELVLFYCLHAELSNSFLIDRELCLSDPGEDWNSDLWIIVF